MYTCNYVRDCCNKEAAELIVANFQAKKCSGQSRYSHFGSYTTAVS